MTRALPAPTLTKYRKMRDFARTAEPRGGAPKKRVKPRADAAPGLSFVVQKHAARRLHYDFRLELDGVLLSWAVPKGPSLVPGDKRLAVETEPHPLEYGSFEGTIAEGEYGAGTVEIWDHGTWKPEGDARRDYERGRLTFTLQGDKLRGAWHLVRTRTGAKEGKQWLLFKSKDEFAHAERESLKDVEPELATLVTEAPEGEEWLHELKFDGYRLLVRIEGGSVRLLTRNGNDWTERMPSIARAFSALKLDQALIDGEVVVLDEHGVSDFQKLQNSLSAGRDGALVFYAFDLLHLDGQDLRERPLSERKAALGKLFGKLDGKKSPALRLSEHIVGGGPEFFAKACELGVEGIVSKRVSEPYRSGRGRDWLKVKCTKRQEFVIVGYTEPGGSRSHFGALLLAVKGDNGFAYAGRVGTGFNEASLAELHRRLAALESSAPKLENAPRGADARGVTWVRPELVAEITFGSMTSDGLLRHASFVGLRDDKPAAEVRAERAERTDRATRIAKTPRADAARAMKRTATGKSAKSRAAEQPSKAASYPLTNPDKILYPEQSITKRELLDYYELVAERMLPHVANRPLTLVRCPNGYTKCFFQKHPGEGTPAGMRSVNIREKDGKAPYSVIDDVEGLFGLLQLGALEIHTWGSHADDFEHPDLLVFDLDPDENVPFTAVMDAAREVRSVFQAAKLETFVKTAGGKGLHVCLPIRPELDWEQAKAFCQRIAEELVRNAPDRYVATVSKAKRRGKIFVDYLRNARGATFVAPYSTRARKNAPVAMPLEWDELTKDLKPDAFTVRNVRERLARGAADPFARMPSLAPSLKSLIAK